MHKCVPPYKYNKMCVVTFQCKYLPAGVAGGLPVAGRPAGWQPQARDLQTTQLKGANHCLTRYPSMVVYFYLSVS